MTLRCECALARRALRDNCGIAAPLSRKLAARSNWFRPAAAERRQDSCNERANAGRGIDAMPPSLWDYGAGLERIK